MIEKIISIIKKGTRVEQNTDFKSKQAEAAKNKAEKNSPNGSHEGTSLQQ